MQLLESGARKRCWPSCRARPDASAPFWPAVPRNRTAGSWSVCARSLWPQAGIRVGSDRQSGFAAAFGDGDGIAVIAGTGSAVTGRNASNEDGAGGWGHLLGDSGGGYDLAIRALRRVLFDFDTGRRMTPLARDFSEPSASIRCAS